MHAILSREIGCNLLGEGPWSDWPVPGLSDQDCEMEQPAEMWGASPHNARLVTHIMLLLTTTQDNIHQQLTTGLVLIRMFYQGVKYYLNMTGTRLLLVSIHPQLILNPQPDKFHGQPSDFELHWPKMVISTNTGKGRATQSENMLLD